MSDIVLCRIRTTRNIAKIHIANNTEDFSCLFVFLVLNGQENMVLKEQLENVLRENAILKRAVAIQHDRQKEFASTCQELGQLKQLVAQYQEQVRNLEVQSTTLVLDFDSLENSSL